MIKKQYVKSRKVTKVVFQHPSEVEVDAIELIADVHDWRPLAFGRLRNGTWKLVQELAPGTAMQFRYRVRKGDAVTYWNDGDADGVVPNVYGAENAVVAG